MHYTDGLKQGIALGTCGDFGYARSAGLTLRPGALTYGLEYVHNYGPCVPRQLPQGQRAAPLRGARRRRHFRRHGHGLRRQVEFDGNGCRAQRAVDQAIGRFGSLDTSDGGESQRYSLSFDYATPMAGGQFQTTAYWFRYKLNLFSNFTYFLDDPENGDQFEQTDDRNVYGWTGSWNKRGEWFGAPTNNTLGFELRQDRINPVYIYSALLVRSAGSTTREDVVDEGSIGALRAERHAMERLVPFDRGPALRLVPVQRCVEHSRELRQAYIRHRVAQGLVRIRPLVQDRIFHQRGHGLPQQRRRGVTISVDPKSDDPVESATPLVRSTGGELGVRTEAIRNVQSSLALWYLKLDSELVFVGDAGTTEAGRPSQRYGVEWNNRWRPLPWLFADLDVAWNHARFTESAPEGNFIPGAPDAVVSAGLAVDHYGPWSGAVFLRYVGSYPLVEDNSVRAPSSTVVDAQSATRSPPIPAPDSTCSIFFNAQTYDIAELRRVPAAPASRQRACDHLHFHPGEKRSFRVSLSYRF